VVTLLDAVSAAFCVAPPIAGLDSEPVFDAEYVTNACATFLAVCDCLVGGGKRHLIAAVMPDPRLLGRMMGLSSVGLMASGEGRAMAGVAGVAGVAVVAVVAILSLEPMKLSEGRFLFSNRWLGLSPALSRDGCGPAVPALAMAHGKGSTPVMCRRSRSIMWLPSSKENVAGADIALHRGPDAIPTGTIGTMLGFS